MVFRNLNTLQPIRSPKKQHLFNNLEGLQTQTERFIASSYFHDVGITAPKEYLSFGSPRVRLTILPLVLSQQFRESYPYTHISI